MSSRATSCTAPSIGYMCIVDFIVGIDAPNRAWIVDRLVGDLVDEVGPPVPLLAARVERVERALEHRVRHRAGAVQQRLGQRVQQRRHRLGRAGLVADVAPDHAAHLAQVDVLRERRPRAGRCGRRRSRSARAGRSGGTRGTPRSTSALCSTGQNVGPPMIVPTSCRRNVNDVTAPKLPPPPRSAQNRSGCSSAFAVTWRPSASTTSASSRLSIERPKRRVRWPRPPPSVRPPTPVVEMIPLGVASPCSPVARSTSPQVQPPPTRTVRAAGSTRMSLNAERSTTRPSSTVPSPAPLWPPPRIASRRSCSRAKRIAPATPAASSGRAISAGRRSIIAL